MDSNSTSSQEFPSLCQIPWSQSSFPSSIALTEYCSTKPSLHDLSSSKEFIDLGLFINISQKQSSITIPRTCEVLRGPDKPSFEPRNHCFLHLRKVVSPLAEIRERDLPSGPPKGGFPNGIKSPISYQKNSNLQNFAVPYLFYFHFYLFSDALNHGLF